MAGGGGQESGSRPTGPTSQESNRHCFYRQLGFIARALREKPDLSALDFSQRHAGTFSDDGNSIVGSWEIRHAASDWRDDFDLTYTKVSV
jgi:hypothetical protein